MSMTIDDASGGVTFSTPLSGFHWTVQGSSTSYNNTLSLTRTKGAWASFTFTGNRIAVYGLISPSGTGDADAEASFTIDGGPATPKYTAVRTSNTQSRVEFFNSGVLPNNGAHSITVTNLIEGAFFWLDSFEISGSDVTNTFLSSSAQTLLIPSIVGPPATVTAVDVVETNQPGTRTLSTLVQTNVVVEGTTTRTSVETRIQTATAAQQTPTQIPVTSIDSAQIADTTSSSVPTSGGKSEGVHIGAVVGGVIGGLFLVILAVFLYLWWRRGQRRDVIATTKTETGWAEPTSILSTVIVPFDRPGSSSLAASGPVPSPSTTVPYSSFYTNSTTNLAVGATAPFIHAPPVVAVGKRQVSEPQDSQHNTLETSNQLAGTSFGTGHDGWNDFPGGNFDDSPPAYQAPQTAESARIVENLRTQSKS